MSSSSPQLSRESLTQLIAAAQRAKYPKRVYPAQLQRYLRQWFPRGLWTSIYKENDKRTHVPSSPDRVNPFQHFCRDPPRVSPEWTAALQLVALSRHVSDSLDSAATSSQVGPSDTPPASPTLRTVEYLLRFGVFPPAGWAVTLALLQVWRQEQQLRPDVSDGCFTSSRLRSSLRGAPASTSEQTTWPSFPSALTAPAAAQLLYHISLTPPSLGAWQDALQLYQLTAEQAYTSASKHSMRAPSSAPISSVGGAPIDVAPASSALLKALRHVTLTTLLQAGEWERGLHFYYHSLYQRDLPGTVTTGCLVQALGKAERWAAVLQVYELCVKLLQAQRQVRLQAQPQHKEAPSRDWGTTLSMAMAAVQRCPTAPPTALLAMVQQLHNAGVHGGSPATLPPLVQLDGNFLSAVQALSKEDDRAALLRLTRREGLLDTFKLIRGLVSKHRWEDALMLYAEAVRASASPPALSSFVARKERSIASTSVAVLEQKEEQRTLPPLSRRELIGARLNLLHGSAIDNVAIVVTALNKLRDSGATADASVLSDQEVECVLSKTLEASEARLAHSESVRDFWQYCLHILQCNYGTTKDTDDRSEATRSARAAPQKDVRGVRASLLRVREPTTAALSFLLRHPRLPWHVALRAVQDYNLLDPSPENEEGPQSRGKVADWAADSFASGASSLHRAAVTPRALALSAAVDRLTSQGQQAAAEKLARRALDTEVAAARCASHPKGVSLSVSQLQIVSYPTLQELLSRQWHDGLYVEARVLFHLLRESTKATTTMQANLVLKGSTAEASVMSSSDAFFNHPCGRALTVVHLLLVQSSTMASGGSPSVKAAHIVRPLPASLFLCEAQASDLGARRDVAVETSSRTPWLLAYPSSVHCEVIRVIRCVTTPARRTDAGAKLNASTYTAKETSMCDEWRWTWTLRYLQALARFFGGPQRSRQSTSFSPKGSRTLEEAQEAYYGSTFEAVISLLEEAATPVFAHSSGCTSQMEGRDVVATPGTDLNKQAEMQRASADNSRTSAGRTRVLCQLLERALTRYGCVPPTHMLLPNQLDRLLPPLVRRVAPSLKERAESRTLPGRECDDVVANAQERCAVAAHLIDLVLHALQTSTSAVDVATGSGMSSRPVEPALLNNLLKLCCRVGEYRTKTARSFSQAVGGDTAMSGEALCNAGGQILRLQSERCGLHTVRPGTMTLFYHLCGAAQDCTQGTRSPLPKKVALGMTESLLRMQSSNARSLPQRRSHVESSAATSGPVAHAEGRQLSAGENSPVARGKEGGDGRRIASVVKPYHCELFFSLFGWEDALHVWYPAFPHEVLHQLAGNPHAIDACLTLEERARK